MANTFKTFLLPVLVTFSMAASPAAAASEEEQTSYSLQFEIAGDFAYKFSTVVSKDFTLSIEDGDENQFVVIDGDGEIRGQSGEKIALDFKFDLRLEKGDSIKVRVTTQGGVVTASGQETTLFSSGNNSLKVVVVKQ